MNILLTWISTIIISKVMNVITVSRILKDIYYSGYKINSTEMKKIKVNNTNKIRNYIMFLNIFDSINMGIKYLNNQNEMINFLFVNNSLEEMTKEEKESFRKKPTIINAILISENTKKNEEIKIDKESELKNIIKISFLDKGSTSFSLSYIKLNSEKIKVNEVVIRTDLINNLDSTDEYMLFIVKELRAINKILDIPIKKERIIKYINRINKKIRINISEEVVNKKEEESFYKNNTKASISKKYKISDPFFDKKENTYVTNNQEEEKKNEQVVLGLNKRRNNNND